MITVNEVVAEIKEAHKQVGSSQKDEVRVMQSMLNDTSYEVGVYSKEGKIGTYSPGQDFKSMQTNIVSQVAKISKPEAESLVSDYEATKSDATTMVNISKEFINTYLASGRKLPLGGRENFNFALAAKNIPETTKTYQKKITNKDGVVTWEPVQKDIPEHVGLKAKSSCPDWVK